MSNNHVQEICTKGSLSIVGAFLTHSIRDLPERMSRLYSDVSGLRSTRWVSYSSCTQYRCRESVSFPSSSLLRYLYILPTSVLWSLVAYCSASVLLVGVEAWITLQSLLDTYGDSDVISMPAVFRRHLVGKALINVFHCDSAEICFVGNIMIIKTFHNTTYWMLFK